MKTVFMFMLFDLNNISSIEYKFIQQIIAFKNLGFNVYYIGYRKNYFYIINNDTEIEIGKILFSKIKIVTRILTYLSLYKTTYKFIKNSSNIWDLIYCRNLIATPQYEHLLKLFSEKSLKLVIEIPTYPPQKEQKMDKRIFRIILFYVRNYYDKRCSKYVSLYSLIGEPGSSYYDRPAVNIINGVYLDFPQHHCINQKEIHLLALGVVSYYHGFERIIIGLHEYYESTFNNDSVILHIVGTDGDGTLLEIQKLVLNLHLQDYVIFEGPLYGEKLNQIFDKCDAAFDSLGLYKMNIHYWFLHLKSSEYIGRGIPFFCETNNNVDFSDIPYCFGIADYSSKPIDIALVVSIVKTKIRKNKDCSYMMRTYAKEKMTWEKQLSKVL